ncbi:MAG TPA: hypothetical protein VFQ43_17685 [Nitrososphaera sp.]|nr:hypothetical protein [Nitrososphaera sp.]
MELRNHPVMFCDGVRTWPPKWQQTYGPGNASVAGEIGKLDAIFLSNITPPHKVYVLTITDEGTSYLGSLIFERPICATAVFDLLYKQIGKPLTVLGSMDLPSCFGD